MGAVGMTGMEKMWASFVAIGLMALASALITFARYKTTGFIKFILSLISFIMLIVAVLYMLLSLL